jgi:hypothetical protein
MPYDISLVFLVKNKQAFYTLTRTTSTMIKSWLTAVSAALIFINISTKRS